MPAPKLFATDPDQTGRMYESVQEFRRYLYDCGWLSDDHNDQYAPKDAYLIDCSLSSHSGLWDHILHFREQFIGSPHCTYKDYPPFADGRLPVGCIEDTKWSVPMGVGWKGRFIMDAIPDDIIEKLTEVCKQVSADEVEGRLLVITPVGNAYAWNFYYGAVHSNNPMKFMRKALLNLYRGK